MTDYAQRALDLHRHYQGKLDMVSKVPLSTREDMATYYSPGVAAPCKAIAQDPETAYDYTWKSNTIAIVSDGSAVLGLGNIGGSASLPVMEGKAILFKEFGKVNCVPIVLNTQDPDEVIETIVRLAPTFGGINLEDIKAPHCFYIEEQLHQKLSIPVFHDDQHGTAIVVLAGMINSLRLTQKKFSDIKVVISGAGAAGIAIGKLLIAYGVRHIVMTDSKGTIYAGRDRLNPYKELFVPTNLANTQGGLAEAVVDADVFVGVSQPNILTAEMVQTMADNPVIFGLANPDPEISPDEAHKGGAYIVATGRSDYPNQVNNVLAFPGLFRGLLDARIPKIEDRHKIAVAETIASFVEDPRPDCIIPDVFASGMAEAIAQNIVRLG